MAGCGVRLRGVSKTFESDGREVAALRDVSLDIEAGEFVIVVGENGSGKTSLLRLLARELVATSGDIEFLNGWERIAAGAPAHGVPGAIVSRVHQNPDANTVGSLTILDNLRLVCMRSAVASPWKLHLDDVCRRRAQEFLGALGLPWTRRVAGLSQGQRQMLAIHMALLREPSLLLLDEHTASLDEANELECMRLTQNISRQTGVTIVMVTHNFAHAAAYGDRLVVLRRGEVINDLKGEAKRTLKAVEVFTLCGLTA